MGPVFTVILNPGTYYIGYSDNFDKVQIQFALRRKVNTDLNIDGTLVTDPARNQGFPLGSEVTFNNGSLLGNTITEGFTRNLYLMVEDRLRDPMSRLDYDWYSSNENVAKVTKYGTVLALNVIENTTVTIYAINKDDPSIVYKKDFIILKETKTDTTKHAEIIAIQKASKKLKEWRLLDCDMYVTLEPCSMCAGAMIQARIRKVYIGAMDDKTGACGSVLKLSLIHI